MPVADAPWQDFGAEGGLFRRLREACAGDWAAYTWHPFVQGLSDGTLPLAAFRRYLIQDYLFLIHFARAKALQLLPTVEIAVGDVHDEATLARMLRQTDAVINLVAVLHGSEDAFERTHVRLPARLAAAARAVYAPRRTKNAAAAATTNPAAPHSRPIRRPVSPGTKAPPTAASTPSHHSQRAAARTITATRASTYVPCTTPFLLTIGPGSAGYCANLRIG